MTYANIGGIALLFFIFTAVASSEDVNTKDSMSTRSTLVILLSAIVFGFTGEYAMMKSGDGLMSFVIAFSAGGIISGLYVLFRLMTRQYGPQLEAEDTDTTTEAS